MSKITRSVGTPDNEININTPDQWDTHYREEPELLEEQLLGIYERVIGDITLDMSTYGRIDILDIGGASGIGANYIKDAHNNCDITVMEISQVACDTGASMHPRVSFICGDIRVDDIGAYDCIIASQVLEHVDDLDAVMVKLMASLPPGGRLYIGIPHEDDLYVWHQHRFSHESYHYFSQYSTWVSFSSDYLHKGNDIERSMFIRLEKGV